MQSGHVPSSHRSLEEDGEAAGAHDTHRLGEQDDDVPGINVGLDVVAETEVEKARMNVVIGVVAPDRHHPNGMGSLLGFRTGSSKQDCGWQLPE